jgi:hypothetical protein
MPRKGVDDAAGFGVHLVSCVDPFIILRPLRNNVYYSMVLLCGRI